ncbi:transporter [Aquimarina sp. 2201CG5-10]|uniref:OmpP1/FadL family transporter n=1 Tax=Aquimarina callyspongiae TaxID=3098150 RepID=UPI002AB5997C|nr:transporter [Aquimarina sp. 2201CG5-10]MDY8134260.1 transporter [Aquimarina sp. 2201CG5-10]
MKKLFLFIAVISVSILNAQDITDAVRYSQQEIMGTARYRAMSGAFGALGGDLSAIQINPAGSAVFLRSSASITISSSGLTNDVSYQNGFNSETSNNLNFNQLGAIFIYNDYSDSESSGINKISFGLAYDQTADYKNDFFAFGRANNSISSFFLEEAQGLPLDLIARRDGETIESLYAFLGENEGFSAQQAFLGYEGFIFDAVDPDDPNNTAYTSNVAPGFFDQEYLYESTGLNGKFTLNAGAQINKDFYFGINLNSHFINYDRFTEFYESNNNAGSNINEITFGNRLSTTGAGFSAQIGGITKVSDILRLGASFESPTWYYITEETTQALRTVSDTDGTAIIAPNVVNVFPEYRLRTPSIATGSAAILFGKKGLISIDYSYKDYTSTSFSSDEGVNFSAQNRDIDQNLTSTSTIRIGGELRNENWSFRGGYVMEESPYKNELILGDKTGWSFGIGYNFGQTKFDVAYSYSEQESIQPFFQGSGFTNFALLDNQTENITFTLSMNL